MERYKVILEKAFVPLDVRALNYARQVHAGERRHNGQSYIVHPMRVADLVTKYKGKSKHLKLLKSSAYLHDTIENTDTTYVELVRLFGPQIANIVLELTTDEDLKNELGKARYLELKMKNMSSWALTIKLCDRLDNLQDMKSSPKEFIDRQVADSTRLMTYLINHRTLTNTQIAISEDILKCLLELKQEDEQKNAIVSNLLTYLESLHSSREQYSMSLQRIKTSIPAQ